MKSWCRGSHNYHSLFLPLLATAAAAVRRTVCARYDVLVVVLLLRFPLVATPKHEKSRLLYIGTLMQHVAWGNIAAVVVINLLDLVTVESSALKR